jgi:hypothetical protein
MKNLWLFLFAATLSAQTLITLPGTVQHAGVPSPGAVIGINYAYGAGQLLKSLNYANFGYFPQAYWQSAWDCSQGGTQTTTNWYNADSGSGGYAAGFFTGATYLAVSQSGTLLGSGTITANTANTSSGINFTLSPALSSACTTGSNTTLRDSLIVQLRSGTGGLMTPANELDHLTGTTSWSSDVSSASPNQVQSLQIAGGTVQFYLDQTQTNPANTSSSTAVNSININGSYTGTYKAKCVTSGCSVAYNLARGGGTTFLNSSDSPSTGAWTTYTHTFTGSETGSQNGQLVYALTCTGTCKLQDADIIEGSTLAGNTSAYRDDVVQNLQASAGDVVRLMEPTTWCTDVLDQLQPIGGSRVCSLSHTQFSGDNGFGQPSQPIPPFLALMQQMHKAPYITLGKFNTAADYTLWAQYLGGSCGTTGGAIRCAQGQTATWNSVFSALGLPIYTAIGNELWNTGAGGWIDGGNGNSYGYLVGQDVTAFKAASGYSSTSDKIIAGGQIGGSQGFESGGWTDDVLVSSGCSIGTPTPCPHYVEMAPYTLNTLDSLTDPYKDEIAEITNIDSVPSPPYGATSMYAAQQFAATFGVNLAVYEVSYSPTSGTATPTQAQMNGITGSVGMALVTMEHELLMQRDAHIYGPINEFALTDQIANSACCSRSDTAWQAVNYLAAGPGQIGTWNDTLRPIGILQQLVTPNLYPNLMNVTQASTPTFNYSAGQGGTILANTAVPYVQAFAYSDGSTHRSLLVFNNNDGATEGITITGADEPVGTVTKTVFGGATNSVTDNNDNFNINNNASTPPVVAPTATTLSGLTDTLPANSVTIYNWTTGAPPPPTVTGVAFTIGRPF